MLALQFSEDFIKTHGHVDYLSGERSGWHLAVREAADRDADAREIRGPAHGPGNDQPTQKGGRVGARVLAVKQPPLYEPGFYQ